MKIRLSLLALAILLAGVGSIAAGVALPSVFSDHMVMQREKPIRIWGWGIASDAVSVTLGPHATSVTVDEHGNWQVELPPLEAGGPYEMVVEAGNRLVVKDILIGEVWLCSGQSNMALKLKTAAGGLDVVLRAKHPRMRLFRVPYNEQPVPQRDVDARWQPCEPKTAAKFSAVAYHFGRILLDELDVPIGLIDASRGGSRIAAWTPVTAFESGEERTRFLAENRDVHERYEEDLVEYDAYLEARARGETVAEEVKKPTLRRGRTYLYNGMIRPIEPFAIRGILWYQGESDRFDGLAYRDPFIRMIRGWRDLWRESELPFYFVQLPPYNYSLAPRANTPSPLILPLLREAQAGALVLTNTGMVVTMDVGDLDDVHPTRKEPVGRRLAALALARTYGRDDVVCSGPVFRDCRVEDSRVAIAFDHAAGLRSSDGEPLSWFQIAGEDCIFHDAQAHIVSEDNERVMVWNDTVPRPVVVRFGWHESAEPNLVNGAGWPAAPFRTDRWPVP